MQCLFNAKLHDTHGKRSNANEAIKAMKVAQTDHSRIAAKSKLSLDFAMKKPGRDSQRSAWPLSDCYIL
jgi:hypothetical protein